MTASIDPPTPRSEAGEWIQLELPEDAPPSAEAATVAKALAAAMADASHRQLPAVLVSIDRPLTSIDQIQRAVDRCGRDQIVVFIAAVTDTVRDSDGALVARSELVEVCAPVVIGHAVASRIVASTDASGAASVPAAILAATSVGAELSSLDDDGSGMWAGTTDALSVARARVEP